MNSVMTATAGISPPFKHHVPVSEPSLQQFGSHSAVCGHLSMDSLAPLIRLEQALDPVAMPWWHHCQARDGRGSRGNTLHASRSGEFRTDLYKYGMESLVHIGPCLCL